MVEAETRWLGDKGNPAAAVRRDEWGTLLGRSIDFGRNQLPVPVELFGCVGLVMNVDCDLHSFLEAKQRPRKLTVVRGNGENAIGSNFQRLGGYGQRVIGGGLSEKDRRGGSRATPVAAPAAFKKSRRERDQGDIVCRIVIVPAPGNYIEVCSHERDRRLRACSRSRYSGNTPESPGRRRTCPSVRRYK